MVHTKNELTKVNGAFPYKVLGGNVVKTRLENGMQ